jgi:hypothetical protein
MINGGVADTLDEAKAAFRAAWERPLCGRKSRRDVLSLSLSAHDPVLTLRPRGKPALPPPLEANDRTLGTCYDASLDLWQALAGPVRT